jgi:hypothetical protein
MAGVAILLAGAVVGYLAAGAVQLRAQAPQASRGALLTVTGRWALLAGVVTAAVALAMAIAGIRRQGPRARSSRVRPDGRRTGRITGGELAAGAPPASSGDALDHG